jgi:formylmethanofuran dehydrogenase subunit A
MMGNNHLIMEQIAKQTPELIDAAVAWLLNSTGGYASSW